ATKLERFSPLQVQRFFAHSALFLYFIVTGFPRSRLRKLRTNHGIGLQFGQMAWHRREALAIYPRSWISAEQGKAMRKLIGYGILGATLCAAVCCLATNYMGRHADATVANDELKGRCAACSPFEEHTLDTLLPDPTRMGRD